MVEFSVRGWQGDLSFSRFRVMKLARQLLLASYQCGPQNHPFSITLGSTQYILSGLNYCLAVHSILNQSQLWVRTKAFSSYLASRVLPYLHREL